MTNSGATSENLPLDNRFLNPNFFLLTQIHPSSKFSLPNSIICIFRSPFVFFSFAVLVGASTVYQITATIRFDEEVTEEEKDRFYDTLDKLDTLEDTGAAAVNYMHGDQTNFTVAFAAVDMPRISSYDDGTALIILGNDPDFPFMSEDAAEMLM